MVQFGAPRRVATLRRESSFAILAEPAARPHVLHPEHTMSIRSSKWTALGACRCEGSRLALGGIFGSDARTVGRFLPKNLRNDSANPRVHQDGGAG
jgi:hypothetical protein